MSVNSSPITFDRAFRIISVVCIVVLLIFVVRWLSSVLLPFAVAWLVAYILSPAVSWVQDVLHLRSRTIPVAIVLSALCLSLSLFLYWTLPQIFAELVRLRDLVQSYIGSSTHGMVYHLWHSAEDYLRAHFGVSALLASGNAIDFAKGFLSGLGGILSGSFGIFAFLFSAFLSLLYLIFILKDFSSLSSGIISLTPRQYRPIASDILRDLEANLQGYFRGQFLVALIVGVLFAIGFKIIGLPLPLVMGCLLAVLNLVPYLQTVSIPLAASLMVIQCASAHASPFLPLVSLAAVYIIVQIIQDLFLVPRIMGRNMGLSPAVILLSLSVWGYALGLLGMIIALPVSTLLIIYYKRLVLKEEAKQNND